MRIRRPPPTLSILSSLLLLPSLTSAAGTLDCSHVRVDKVSFDLSALAGVHTLSHTRPHPPTIYNTTYTLDLCAPLPKPKNLPNKKDACSNGSRVCAIERHINPGDDESVIGAVIPIAGDFVHEGRALDAKFSRLKTSSSHADATKEGLRLELHGGMYVKRRQTAIVELLCDRDRTGWDGEDGEDKKSRVARSARDKEDDDEAGDDDDDEEGDDDMDRSLRFVSYGPVEEDRKEDVLRLVWHTKYACENTKEEEDAKGNHWGFFTWLIIIVFLATAAYLIFGSWLNYNRYGARGWDLLPHGDTLRDLPYLLKDWTRRVINTVQGGGSRGGYSAV
ncbi:MAG: hypothetical protein M1817_001074 [Caeruleum heppii]|nr:MAG: hypothetical protein M1817_001074 [Caeruleum heppii]